MGMRITTSMMMNSYRFNLQGSTKNMSDARDKVLTHRKFNSYAEDPGSATQAWRIRRAMSSNFDYQANNSDTYSRFNIAWTTMGVVNHDLEDLDGRFSTIRGVNGATASGRQPLGKVLDESAETIIQAMNSAKYGDHFVFSGDDEMNAPFTWSADMKTLYYRGVNVGAGGVQRPSVPEWTKSATRPAWADSPKGANGWPEDMPVKSDNPQEQKWIEYYQNGATGPQPNLPLDMPDKTTVTNPWELSFIEYYEDREKASQDAYNQAQNPNVPITPTAKGLKMPTEEPAWTKSKLDANFLPENMPPEDEMTTWDKMWKDYCVDQAAALKDPDNHKPTVEKPSIDPSVNNAAKWGEKDRFGVPANIKEIMADPNSTEYDKAWAEYLWDQGDVAKLDYLSKEEENVDLGMGLEEDKSDVLINGTAFNRSLPGINMLGGYGLDEDGDPKNVVLLMKRVGELCSNANPDTGAWDPDPERAKEIEQEAFRLLDKLNAAHHRTTESYTEIETKAHFLQENQTRLETQGDYLQEERVNLEQVDLADAITEFSWDYYCYSAALKIGTQLLSQTLLDYMG